MHICTLLSICELISYLSAHVCEKVCKVRSWPDGVKALISATDGATTVLLPTRVWSCGLHLRGDNETTGNLLASFPSSHFPLCVWWMRWTLTSACSKLLLRHTYKTKYFFNKLHFMILLDSIAKRLSYMMKKGSGDAEAGDPTTLDQKTHPISQ